MSSPSQRARPQGSSQEPPSPTGPVDCIFIIAPVGYFYQSRGIRRVYSALDAHDKLTPELIEKAARKSIAPFLRDNGQGSIDEYDVLIRHSLIWSQDGRPVYRYLSPFCRQLPTALPKAPYSGDATAFEVEVWRKDDETSPAHVYKRNDVDYPVKLKVAGKQMASPSPGYPTAGFEPKEISFHASLATAQCVSAFRRDLNRRIVRAAKLSPENESEVEVYFKRSRTHTAGSSKESFEARVADCLLNATPLSIQYAVRPKKARKQPAQPAVATQMQAPATTTARHSSTSSTFKVTDKRAFTPSVMHPRTSSPAPTPASGGSFPVIHKPLPPSNPESIPDLMAKARTSLDAMPPASDDGIHHSTSAYSSLHEGFYDALRRAQPSTNGPPPIPAKTPIGRPSIRANLTSEEGNATLGLQNDIEKMINNNVKDPICHVHKFMEDFGSNYKNTLFDTFGGSTVPGASAQIDTHAFTNRESEARHASAEPKLSSTEPAQQVEHNASCNMCRKQIKGIRWKCTACVDVDVCSTCKPNTPFTHPYHRWSKLTQADAVPTGVQPSNWVAHPRIVCDGCDANIVGPRYKCIVCDDFDWCYHCEADPAIQHDPGQVPHLFLKIDKPLRGGSNASSHQVHLARSVMQALKTRAVRNEDLVVDLDLRKLHGDVVNTAEPARLASAEAACPMPGGFIEKPAMTDTTAVKKEGSQNELSDLAVRLSDVEKTVARLESRLHSVVDIALRAPTAPTTSPKKRSERPDGNDDTSDSKRTALEAGLEMQSLQARLAALTTEAQKLPGADFLSTAMHDSTSSAEQPRQKQAQMATENESTSDIVEDYDMTLESDVTVPDGTRFVPGSRFDKVWRIRNSGLKAWPMNTQIVPVGESANDPSLADRLIKLNKLVRPGESTDVRISDLHADSTIGRQTHYFRLALPNGPQAAPAFVLFGDQLWCQIEVSDTDSSASQSIESSVHSSKVPATATGSISQDEQGVSGSSFFRAPLAPESVTAASDRQGPSTLPTPRTERSSMIGDEEEEEDVVLLDSDDDFEIVDPTSDEESEEAAF